MTIEIIIVPKRKIGCSSLISDIGISNIREIFNIIDVINIDITNTDKLIAIDSVVTMIE